MASMDVDTVFLKSKRGILKVGEMVAFFVAFVCFVVGSSRTYIAATLLEFLITSSLLLLYLLKLNKRLTFFFWPLIDFFNSIFASFYFIVLSLLALTTFSVKGTLAGGIVGLVSVALLCIDSILFFKNITFNKPRNTAQSQQSE